MGAWHYADRRGLFVGAPVITGAFPLALQWSADVQDTVVGVAYGEGVIVARTQAAAVALDASTGALLWRQSLDDAFSPQAPQIAGGSVSLAAGRVVQTLDLASGRVLWTTPEATFGEPRVLAASECCVVVDRLSEDLTIYDQLSGAARWVLPTSRGYVTAYVDGDALLVPDRGVAAYDLLTGKLLWHDGRDSIGASAYANGRLFVHSSGIEAIDVARRAWLWSVSPLGDGLPAFVAADNQVVVSDSSGVYALDASTGHVIWSTTDYRASRLVRLGKIVYLYSDFSQTVAALAVDTGDVLGSLQLGDQSLPLPWLPSGAVAPNDAGLLIGHLHTVYSLVPPEVPTTVLAP